MFTNIDRIPNSGYKLFDLGSHWEFHSSTRVFRGKFEDVRFYAVFDLGFNHLDIDLAVDQMKERHHEGAEFGIYKHFLFTFERDISHEKITMH